MYESCFTSYLTATVSSLQESKKHYTTISESSSRLKSLNAKTEESVKALQEKINECYNKLKPIEESASSSYLKYKNSIECSTLLDTYVKLSDLLDSVKKIIEKDGLGKTNKQEYFDSVRKIKKAINYYHVNAPGNPDYFTFKYLLNDALNVLHKEVEIELNNAPVYKFEKIKSVIYQWVNSGERTEIDDKDCNYMIESAVTNLTSLMSLLEECEDLQTSIDSYISMRYEFFERIFFLIKEDALSTAPMPESYIPPTRNPELKLSINPLSLKQRMGTSRASSRNVSQSLVETEKSPSRNLNFNYFSSIHAVFVLLYKPEMKYASQILPELHHNNVLSTLYTKVLKYFQTEIEEIKTSITSTYNFNEISTVTLLLKNIIPILDFVYGIQNEMFSLAKGSPFVHVRKVLTQYLSSLESTILSAAQEIPKLITGLSEKPTPASIKSSGLFDYMVLSHQFMQCISQYSRPIAYCFFKLTKSIPYNEFDSRSYTYLHSYTNTAFDVLRSNVSKTADKFEFPLKSISIFNNYEFFMEFLQSDEVTDIITKDYRQTALNSIKNALHFEMNAYRDCWIRIFEELLEHAITVTKELKDVQVYGKQLNTNKKTTTKAYFKNVNSNIESFQKKHEGIYIYSSKVSEKVQNLLKTEVLPKYTTIYQSFIDIPFSKNNKNYIKYNSKSFSTLIESLFPLNQPAK